MSLSQHLEVRGRAISEFKARLVHLVKPLTSQSYIVRPCLKKRKKRNEEIHPCYFLKLRFLKCNQSPVPLVVYKL